MKIRRTLAGPLYFGWLRFLQLPGLLMLGRQHLLRLLWSHWFGILRRQRPAGFEMFRSLRRFRLLGRLYLLRLLRIIMTGVIRRRRDAAGKQNCACSGNDMRV